jgi:extradiol dioxygenase family protein
MPLKQWQEVKCFRHSVKIGREQHSWGKNDLYGDQVRLWGSVRMEDKPP